MSSAQEPGPVFDPAKHRTDKDGKPLLKSDGSFWPKGGRPPGPAKPPLAQPDLPGVPAEESFDPLGATLKDLPPSPEPAAQPEAQAEAPPPASAAEVASTAALIVATAESALVMTLGPDLRHSEDERTGLVKGWTAYVASKGGFTLTPGWALVATYAGVVAVRLDKPEVQSRLGSLWRRVSGWFRK